MSKLREAAKAALTAYEKFRDVDDIDGLDDAIDRLRAALAEPKTELRDQHKAFTHWYFGLRGINEANFSPEDLAWAAWKAALAQPEAEPPRDEWRPASEPPEDLRRRVIAWRAPPQRKSGTWFEALYDDGAWITRDGIAHDITHWRDIEPPTESPIAAKCQRVEGSGEICGLTPPCPDCGSSLIDVPEGSL